MVKATLLDVTIAGNLIGRSEAIVYDITGKQIWKSHYNFEGESNQFAINTLTFQQGIYTLIVKNNLLFAMFRRAWRTNR